MAEGQRRDFDANVVAEPPEVASHTASPTGFRQGTLGSLAAELRTQLETDRFRTVIFNLSDLSQRISFLEKMVTGFNVESDSMLRTLKIVQARFSDLDKKIADLEVQHTVQATVAGSGPLPMEMMKRGDAHAHPVETLGSTEGVSASDFAELRDYVSRVEDACDTMIESYRDELDLRVTALGVKAKAREEELDSLRQEVHDLRALVLPITIEGQESTSDPSNIRSQRIKEEPDESRRGSGRY